MSFHERVKDIWFERHDAPCFGIDYNVALLRIIDETNVAGSLTEKEQELIGGFLRSGVGDGRLERVRIDLFSGKISETDLAAIQPRIALFEEALNFPLYPETWESEWMARYRQVLQIADVPRLIAAERESDTRRSEHSRYRIFYITAHSPQRNFVRQVKRHLPECELIEVGYNSASGMGYELSRLDYDVDLFYMHLRGAFLTTEELKEILAKIRTRNPDARIFIEGFGTMSVDFELFQERYGKVEVQMEMEHGALWRAAQEGFAAWQASQAAQQAAQQSASAPQTVIARSPEGATKQSHDPSVDLSSVTKFRMLYIDDDAEIRATRMREFSDGLGLAAIASDRLANDEYEIAFAASAEEAIALLDREAFDYVAMDWHIKHAGSGKNAVPDALHRKIIEKRIPQVDVESMPEYRTAPQRMYPGFVTGSFPSDYDEDGSGEARVGRIKEVQSQLSRKRPIALADEEFAAPEEVRIKKTIVGLTEERHLERERLPGGFLYEVASIAVSPDGTRFVTGSDNHGTDVSLWDAATGELIRVFSGHTDRVSTVAFSPDGKRILSGSQDGSVRMWNGATGALIWT